MAGDLIQIYQCFCDRTRLRILHLLAKSPLCVCHFQEILGEPQVKISKHLAYLRKRKMVVAKRDRNWMIYSIPVKHSREWNRFSDMFDATHPCGTALNAHAEACVRYASIPAQVEIPLERLLRQFMHAVI